MSDVGDNGGQAFPTGDPTNGGNDGMTLLDHFAGQALAHPHNWPLIMKLATERKCSPGEALARVCYDWAEDMVVEKRRRETTI